MTDDSELVENVITLTATPDGPLSEDRRAALWTSGVIVLADVLLRTDEFNREKLLRGIEHELREACAGITAILNRSRQPGLPRIPGVPNASQH